MEMVRLWLAINLTTGVSFFVKLSSFSTTYETNERIGTKPNYDYKFNARFELSITINKEIYYHYKDFTPLKISSYKAYNIAGPTASESEIISAEENDELGNGWKRGKKEII